MSLLETLGKSLTPEMVSQISKQLGVDEDVAQKGVQLGIPLLISALNRNAESPEGAEAITKALEKDHDGSVLDNIGDLIGNYQQGEGNGILKHILGGQREKVETAVTQTAGIDGGALLQILAPLVMGALGAQQRNQQLSPEGVTEVLKGSTDQLKKEGNDQMLEMLTNLIDANRDGSILDEVLGFLGRFFSSNKR
jgi:hypothetical protein